MINVDKLAREFADTVSGQTPDLARAALLIARLEHPHLNPTPSLECLDRMGCEARKQLADGDGKTQQAQFEILSRYLFRERGFTGNPADNEDPRNSCLNQVLDRRTGIPVTLGIVFLEVAKRAGVRAAGVNFPGHFLVRLQAESSEWKQMPLIIDPSNSGRIMAEGDCRELLHQHLGDDAEFDLQLLKPASDKQIIVRVLENLKRMYVRLRSFPQARDVTELLLAIKPSGAVDLRDRGLLAYHLRDFSGALRDLEAYLHIAGRTRNGDVPVDRQTEHEQIWEHIKMLRRRVASLN
jgi:regulator of sirC expression with transglutaminase-like and TPR domain